MIVQELRAIPSEAFWAVDRPSSRQVDILARFSVIERERFYEYTSRESRLNYRQK
jgi:hypothetical protein